MRYVSIFALCLTCAWPVSAGDGGPPSLDLYAPNAGTGADLGKLVFSWQASGKRLPPKAVVLTWAEKPAGPWHLIAADLDNRGSHVWQPPPRFPAAVYLRLQAADKDGKSSVAQTPQAFPVAPLLKRRN